MAIFALQKSGATFTVNTLPFIKRVLEKVGPLADFHEVHEQIQTGEIQMEPGDYLSSVNLGYLGRLAGIGITDVENFMMAYVETQDAHLTFNELKLPKLVEMNMDLDQISVPGVVEVGVAGSSIYFTPSEPEMIFATAEKHLINKNKNKCFSVQGFGPDSDGGSRFIVTHLSGFDRVEDLYIPAHYINEDGNPSLAVFAAKVKLPPKPGKNLKIFYCTVSEGKPGIIDLSKEDLFVPYGDSTFTEILNFPHGLTTSFRISPRIIDGLYISPNMAKNGTELVITPAVPIKNTEEKKIYSHIQKINGTVIPICLKIRLVSDN